MPAVWEDFMQTLTGYINSGYGIKALRAKMRDQGWKDLGTGDGKPMHHYENSEVNQWLKRRKL